MSPRSKAEAMLPFPAATSVTARSTVRMKGAAQVAEVSPAATSTARSVTGHSGALAAQPAKRVSSNALATPFWMLLLAATSALRRSRQGTATSTTRARSTAQCPSGVTGGSVAPPVGRAASAARGPSQHTPTMEATPALTWRGPASATLPHAQLTVSCQTGAVGSRSFVVARR